MKIKRNYRTAECVTPKRPDKICDTISDAILDHCLMFDSESRVAIETVGGHGEIFVTGEVTTNAEVPFEEIVRDIYGKSVTVNVNVVQQSNFISQGVDTGGAGDQGIMVGYACDENVEMVPNELYLARQLCKQIYKVYPYDGKTQVTLNGNKIESVVASFQHAKSIELQRLVRGWLRTVSQDTTDVNIYCNPAGDWSLGGFDADAGLTGRKIVIDNYGPAIPVGGGAFSGKDPTKVDRSAAYMARKIAVDKIQTLQKRPGGNEVFVYLAYAIGRKDPVEATIVVNGEESKITGYDLTPQGIIDYLNLKAPQYLQTASWGHMGTNQTWG